MTACLRTRSSTSSPRHCPWLGSFGGTAKTNYGARHWSWRLQQWRTSPHGLRSSVQRRRSWTSCGQGGPSRTRTSCSVLSSSSKGAHGRRDVGPGAAVRCPTYSTSMNVSVGTTLTLRRSFASSLSERDRLMVRSLGGLELSTDDMRRDGRCAPRASEAGLPNSRIRCSAGKGFPR